MKTTRSKNVLLFIVCMVLIAATVLFATGCSNGEDNSGNEPTTITPADGEVLGEGSQQFAFAVTDGEGNVTHLTINTDAETVGDALVELNLIAGDPGDYGMYVKEVLGVTAIYENDGTYWAFYINGEYGMSGVDQTAIEAGATYEFKVEK